MRELTLGIVYVSCASLVSQTVKNLLAIWETQVRSLGLEDSLEKGMATLSSIPAWRIAWREEAGGLQSMGSHTSVCVYIYIHTYIYLVTCISYNLLKNNLNIYLFI